MPHETSPRLQPDHSDVPDLSRHDVVKSFLNEPPDGALHLKTLQTLQQATRFDNLSAEFELLQAAYSASTATDLLGIRGVTEFDYDSRLGRALRHATVLRRLRFIDAEYSVDRDERQTRHHWMSKAVSAATGLPLDQTTAYTYSASRRNPDENTARILKTFDHFGADRIRALTATTGIHGLETYSIGQLEHMSAFARNPAEMAERLADRDTIVVMTNRAGDHKGAFADISALFEEDMERVLFFEINHLSDIYRRMITLRSAGIHPASLVLAAHSAPGQFSVSDLHDTTAPRIDRATIAGKKLVALVNSGVSRSATTKEFAYSMNDMRGIATLVETYMQPSRTIDDSETDHGRKKIILYTCRGASDAPSVDIDNQRRGVHTGMQSIIGQLGADLRASGVHTSVDIYGAPGEIQMTSSSHGIRYIGHSTSPGGTPIPLVAQRLRIEDGTIDTTEVDAIALRK